MKNSNATMKLLVAVVVWCAASVGCVAEEAAVPRHGIDIKKQDEIKIESTKAIETTAINIKNKDLQRLEHYMDFVFKTALSLSSDEDKKKFTVEQNAWIKDINRCAESDCKILSYQTRLKFLSDYNYNNAKPDTKTRQKTICPEIEFMNRESDAQFCITRLLEKNDYSLTKAPYLKTEEQEASCNEIYDRMKNGSHPEMLIEPVVATKDINDPLLKPVTICTSYSDEDSYYPVRKDCIGMNKYYRLSNGEKNGNEVINVLYRDHCSVPFGRGFVDDIFVTLEPNKCRFLWFVGGGHHQTILVK